MRPPAPGPGALLRELAPLFAGFGGFHALLQLDMIYAQATFACLDPQLPGLYASAAVLGRVVLYLPMAIVGVTVSRVVRARERGEPHRHLLTKNLLLWAGLAGSGALVLGLWPAQVLELFGRGEQLVPAAPLLRWYLLPILLFGALHVLMNYYYALGARWHAWVIVGGTVAALLLFDRFHATPEQLILVLASVGAGMLAICSLALLSPRLTPRR